MMGKSQKSENKDSLSTVDIHQFVYERYFEVKNHNDLNQLIQFHTINKYLFMVHSPIGLNGLGNVVANNKKSSTKEIFEEYYYIMQKLLQHNPTIKSHLNTIYHIFGHFSKDLSDNQKKEFLRIIDEFKKNEITLNEVLIILKEWTTKFDKRYLIRQTYFLLLT